MNNTKKICIAMVATAALVAAFNYVFAYRQVQHALRIDPRNAGISAIAYHQWLVNPSTVVFDLRDVDGDKSMTDVTRVLLMFASEMKSRSVDRVILAYKGDQKFYIEGGYFSTLGKEYGTQNPVYTLRTLPQNIKRMDGKAAFGTWTGGVLGVMIKQMEDFNSFHRQWWVDDILQ